MLAGLDFFQNDNQEISNNKSKYLCLQFKVDMIDKRSEIKKCLERYAKSNEIQKEGIRFYTLQFINEEIDSAQFYELLNEKGLIPLKVRGPSDYSKSLDEAIKSDSVLRGIVRNEIIPNKIPALIKYSNMNRDQEE